MITAAQALELVKRSDGEVERALEIIGPAIEEAAKQGRRFLPLSSVVALHSAFSGDVASIHISRSERARATEFQERLITALKSFGYQATFQAHGESYVPRGLADDDGNGPEHQHYTIVVRW